MKTRVCIELHVNWRTKRQEKRKYHQNLKSINFHKLHLQVETISCSNVLNLKKMLRGVQKVIENNDEQIQHEHIYFIRAATAHQITGKGSIIIFILCTSLVTLYCTGLYCTVLNSTSLVTQVDRIQCGISFAIIQFNPQQQNCYQVSVLNREILSHTFRSWWKVFSLWIDKQSCL